jgi:hypothetical protein
VYDINNTSDSKHQSQLSELGLFYICVDNGIKPDSRHLRHKNPYAAEQVFSCLIMFSVPAFLTTGSAITPCPTSLPLPPKKLSSSSGCTRTMYVQQTYVNPRRDSQSKLCRRDNFIGRVHPLPCCVPRCLYHCFFLVIVTRVGYRYPARHEHKGTGPEVILGIYSLYYGNRYTLKYYKLFRSPTPDIFFFFFFLWNAPALGIR